MVLRRGPAALKAIAHALAALPLAWLAWQVQDVLRNGSNALGTEPVVAIEHHLGLWALRMLLLCLAMTPLRQLTGNAAWIGYRRMLGLWAFAYASLHLLAYVALDLRWLWPQIIGDIAKRPYLTVGMAAWLALLPLAATSTRATMRRLGRRWARLHRLVYPAALLAVLHFWWLVKADLREPALYAAILAVLLGWRAVRRFRSAPAARAGSPPRSVP